MTPENIVQYIILIMQSYASRIHINEKNVGFSIDHGFQTIFLLLTPPPPPFPSLLHWIQYCLMIIVWIHDKLMIFIRLDRLFYTGINYWRWHFLICRNVHDENQQLTVDKFINLSTLNIWFFFFGDTVISYDILYGVTSRFSFSSTLLCDKVCQWLAASQWFSPGTLVSSINKTDRHDISEILLKVALNTITTLSQAI